MSDRIIEIINHLKSLTLLEAAELVSHIEECFGVNVTNRQPFQGSLCIEPPTFVVVLEEVPVDNKISVIKTLRILKDLASWEAKEFLKSLPQVVETTNSISFAEDIQRQFEAAGAKASVQRMF
ncbi:MAG TPA: ribosomal protein L7/L12 [Chroococcales cyanobacterium]